MSNTNDKNREVGRIFQEKVQRWFAVNRSEAFELERSIYIGVPAHPHKFDIANESETIVIECKCYMWTDAGNVPSAKLRGLNEAVFYFSFLPAETEKILVMARATHPSKSETLAEYYVRTNKHLLSDVKVWEFDIEVDDMRPIEAPKESVCRNACNSEGKTSTSAIRQHIMEKISVARKEGKTSISIVARDIHSELNLKSSYPPVCAAMRQCMSDKDIIVHTTPSGFSSTFEVEFFL